MGKLQLRGQRLLWQKINQDLHDLEVSQTKPLVFKDYLRVVALASGLATEYVTTVEPGRNSAVAFEAVLRLVFRYLHVSDAQAEKLFKAYMADPE